jgi:protein-tyrosine phosphatase
MVEIVRKYQLDSIMNFRDFGGIPILHSSKLGYIPYNLLYRSGDISKISENDARFLAYELGLHTFIDLRTDDEIIRDGIPNILISYGVNWISSPISAYNCELSKSAKPNSIHYSNFYSQIALNIYPTIKIILTHLTVNTGLPIAFGCYAGKDRTGVIAAVLLMMLEVPNEYICHNYALSARYLRPHIARFSFHWQKKKISSYDYARRLETIPETMRKFIDWVCNEYGSIENLLLTLGLKLELIQSFKGIYLTT